VGAGAAVGGAAMQDRGVRGAVTDNGIALEINHYWYQESKNNAIFSSISTQIYEGRVLLTGAVTDPDTRAEAVRLAWKAGGIREIINEIEVTDEGGLKNFAKDVWSANELRSRLLFAKGIFRRISTSNAIAVFGVFLAQKLANKPFTVVGDGTQRRDFLFVTDVARAFYLAATTSKVNDIYNLGAGNPQTVNRLVELLGGGEVIRLPKRPGEPECTWADISKITRELDWKQQVSIEAGVAQMLAQIDYWRNAPVWDPASIEKATKNWFDFLKGKEKP
jgi:hypothetical protein